MNVCGVLIHTQSDYVDGIEGALITIPGVETHGRSEDGRFIVTVEDTEQLRASEALAKINAVPGIIAATLIYHEFDPEAASFIAKDGA